MGEPRSRREGQGRSLTRLMPAPRLPAFRGADQFFDARQETEEVANSTISGSASCNDEGRAGNQNKNT